MLGKHENGIVFEVYAADGDVCMCAAGCDPVLPAQKLHKGL